MKSILYLIIFALIFLTLLYFNLVKPLDDKVRKPINTVSFQANSTSFEKNKPKPADIPKKELLAEPIDTTLDNTKINNTKENKDSKLDYITAYRDWQYFENCYTDIEDFNNHKDPLQTLTERFANNRESQNEPTHQQNMYYLHHVDICKTLINDVGDEEDGYYQIRQNLRSRFEKIIAKTDQEQQLEHALKMVNHLNSFKLDYSQAHTRQSSLSAEEIFSINAKIEQLTLSMMNIYDGNQQLTQEHTQSIKQYSEEIEQLRLKISNSKTINHEKISQIEKTIDGYLNSMDDYLHRVQSPDAFLAIVAVLYKSEYFKKDSTVQKILKNHTGINDSYYINILNNIVMPLVACSMNYPCDAQSDLILSYCLGLKDSMFNQACGRSLEDFYFNFYIGPNQLNDVNSYFSYLVSRYAN